MTDTPASDPLSVPSAPDALVPTPTPDTEVVPVEPPAPAVETPIPPAPTPEPEVVPAPAPAVEVPVDPAPLIQPGTVDSDSREFGGPGLGWSLRFQNGARELGRNGATSEEVIDALIEHIGYFQKGKYACRENALALTKLEEAKHWLQARATSRVARGVLGRAAA